MSVTQNAVGTTLTGQTGTGSFVGGTAPTISNPTITGLTASSALFADASGNLAEAALTDGQILIGSSIGAPAAANITAGTGISITNGNNTIQISASGAVSFNTVTTSTQALVSNNIYYTTYAGLSVMTLPASPTAGDTLEISSGASGNTFKIAQNSGQQILVGSQGGTSVATTVGVTGYVQSSDPNTAIGLRCVVGGASAVWQVRFLQQYVTVN